jgi:hypothetical protein
LSPASAVLAAGSVLGSCFWVSTAHSSRCVEDSGPAGSTSLQRRVPVEIYLLVVRMQYVRGWQVVHWQERGVPEAHACCLLLQGHYW